MAYLLQNNVSLVKCQWPALMLLTDSPEIRANLAKAMQQLERQYSVTQEIKPSQLLSTLTLSLNLALYNTMEREGYLIKSVNYWNNVQRDWDKLVQNSTINPVKLADIATIIGQSYMTANYLQNAISYFLKAVELEKKGAQPSQKKQFDLYRILGTLYRRVGESRKKYPEMAIIDFCKACSYDLSAYDSPVSSSKRQSIVKNLNRCLLKIEHTLKTLESKSFNECKENIIELVSRFKEFVQSMDSTPEKELLIENLALLEKAFTEKSVIVENEDKENLLVPRSAINNKGGAPTAHHKARFFTPTATSSSAYVFETEASLPKEMDREDQQSNSEDQESYVKKI